MQVKCNIINIVQKSGLSCEKHSFIRFSLLVFYIIVQHWAYILVLVTT